MSSIEANITINLPDGVNPDQVIQTIRNIISNINDQNTHVNVIEMDDPLSMSPINISQLK